MDRKQTDGHLNNSTPEEILLQDLPQQHQTTNGSPPRTRADDVTEIPRLNLDENARRQILEDILGMISQNSVAMSRDRQMSVPTDYQGQILNAIQQRTGLDRTSIPAQTGILGSLAEIRPSVSSEQPNLVVPLKDGYKLDLRDIPSHILPKNMKIKFDTTEQNVTVKNAMQDVAKFGDKYAKDRTTTKGVLTVSILLQNIAQLKSVIKYDKDNTENFWFLVVLIPLSLIIQLVGGAMILYLGNMKTETNEQIKTSYSVGRWLLYVSGAASLLNTVIAALFLSE